MLLVLAAASSSFNLDMALITTEVLAVVVVDAMEEEDGGV